MKKLIKGNKIIKQMIDRKGKGDDTEDKSHQKNEKSVLKKII